MSTLLSLLALLTFSPLASRTDSDPPEISPFSVISSAFDEVRVRVQAPALARLETRRAARLRLPRPGGGSARVEVERLELALAPDALHENGEAVGTLPDLQLWSGRLLGEPESSVFLALSSSGCWGWLQDGERLDHLIAERDASGAWTAGRWMTEARAQQEWTPLLPRCETDTEIAAPSVRPTSGPGNETTANRPVLRSRLALETDWQYYQIFNDAEAAVTYALAIIGAANSRYREQIDVVHTIEYLGYYTTPNDPWSSQDQGGDCYAVIAEFRAQWENGGAPVDADLYHLFTGTDTGCAIASGKICDPLDAFSLTGRMTGQTTFPVAPNPLNWDFVWFCHETGHNYGSPHTHQYCPPLDECAPSGYWGTCQDEQSCTTQATFMSYCHACPGGLANYTTWFHPVVADVMRTQAESGCISLFEGVLTADLGQALAGSNGTPELFVSWLDGPNALRLAVNQGPSNAPGVYITSPFRIDAPFFGGVLVPDLTFLLSFGTDWIGNHSLQIPVTSSHPFGVTLISQAWFVDPLGTFAASNAVEWELIKP